MSELNDKELFEAAISDAPVETVETPAEPEVTVESGGPVRDEKGRFAPKEQEEPVAQVQEQPVAAKPDEAHVPSWRLREVNEAKEAAERRAQEAADRAAQFERQMSALQQQMASLQKPQEPVDPWSDLPGFVNTGVREQIDPIRGEITSTREYYSRKDAIREHGEEKVNAAYQALGKGLSSGDPEAAMTYQRAMQSIDPYADIMKWHTRVSLHSEIGGDINAYRQRVMDEALKDPAFLAKAVEAVRGQQTGSKPTTVQLPPSINRATSAASPHDESADVSDRGLYNFATR